MDVFYQEFRDQLFDSLDNVSSLGRLSFWLTKHTKLRGRPYSLKDHECHQAIIDSKHPNLGIIKPSQMGLTEAGYRGKLAFLATNPSTGLVLLPTEKEALRMVKSRIDPIISGSKYLKGMLAPGSDSSSFKQLGTSQLYAGGTKGKDIISIPVDHLDIDELDYCDQEKVSTAESRMTHSEYVFDIDGVMVRGIKRKWSTPTAKGFGVDRFFSESNQYHRLQKCPHPGCGHWFWPDYLKHVVIDGWDKPMEELTYLDAQILSDMGKLSTARLLCEKCGREIKPAQMGPENREWVAYFPSRKAQEGWRLTPFDMPAYHTPASVTMKLISYGANIGKFRNFVLGQAYSDATNSVVDEMVEKYTTVRPVPPEVAAAGEYGGMVAGLDVGRTSWLLIGRPFPDGTLDVVWAEQVRLRDPSGADLKEKVIERLRQFRVYLLVCDALPYTDSILSIQEAQPEGWVVPNFYALRDKKLPMYVINDKEWSVNSNRTKTLDYFAKQVNSGKVRWPQNDEMKVVRKHLQGMKRIDQEQDDGSVESTWEKCGDDHYFHAGNYLQIAALMAEESFGGGFAMIPTLHEVQVGSKAIDIGDTIS